MLTYFSSFPKMTSLPLPSTLPSRDSLPVVFHSSCKFPKERNWRSHAIPQRISASSASQNAETPMQHRQEKTEQLLLQVIEDRRSRWEKLSGGGRGRRADRSGQSQHPRITSGSSLLFSSNLSPCSDPDIACHLTGEVQPDWCFILYSFTLFTPKSFWKWKWSRSVMSDSLQPHGL